jgi:LacI family transcriptional regulator
MRGSAIRGLDGISGWIRPTLTTIALPHYEMGKRAVQLALGDTNGEASPQQVTLACRLVTRKST